MTDNDIIKALERCPQHRECCYCNSVEECGSKKVLVASVLDLINQQKTQIEKLESIEHYAGEVIKNQEAEIEMMKKSQTPRLFGQDYRFCNLLGETLVFSKKLKHYNDMIKELKTEAIKEFAERVCKDRVSNDPVVIAVKTELKMTEEQND